MLLIIIFVLVVISVGLYKHYKDQQRMAMHSMCYSLLRNMRNGDINTIYSFLQAIQDSGCSIEEYVSNLPLSYTSQVEMRNLLRTVMDAKIENSNQKDDLEISDRIVPYD